MEAGFYAIQSTGNKVPGASGAIEVQLSGIAKDDSSEPYSVANEYICARLAAAIGLPVPPGTIARTSDGKSMFVSLRFSAGPTSLPPVDPAQLVTDHPETAAGVLVFDCWVGNWDRNSTNLAYVSGVSGVGVFDHGRTLLRRESGSGAAHVDQEIDRPHVYDNHVLRVHLNSLAALENWSARVAGVPSELISDACGVAARLDVCQLGDAQAVEKFLDHRKTRIMEYLAAEQGKLPGVTGWKVSP